MIGMSFAAFLTLLVISAIWSAIVHGAGYGLLSGAEGYFAKLIIGWIGGWIGSPVLGYWGGSIAGSNVHLIPAILGSIAAIFMQIAVLRALTVVTLHKASLPTEPVEKRVA
jgi:uncharacterized membrane protein YeaQ/YmgE (transglycosylase-associated protein family)